MDIVERLREGNLVIDYKTAQEAADEIERLRTKIAEYELWLGRIIFGGVTDDIIEQVRTGSGAFKDRAAPKETE
jgi:hypothetical protein